MAQALTAGLTPDILKMLILMVRGVDSRPLSLPAAAIRCGVPVRAARDIADSPAFRNAFMEEIENYRQSLEPSNIATAIAIRDDLGDASPERDSVRLKAIQILRGTPKPPSVNVQINNKTDIYAKFTPGYVIKLDDAPLIEHASDE